MRISRSSLALACCVCVILTGSTLRLQASPAWAAGERLADLLLYHYLVAETRFDEAGQVLERLLVSGQHNPHLKVLEAEYALTMYERGRGREWLERAGRSSQAALAAGALGWRGQLVRSRWNDAAGKTREALRCAKLALQDEEAPRIAWNQAITLADRLAEQGELGQLLEGAKARGFLDGVGLQILGMIRLSEGQLSEAIANLESAQDSLPPRLALQTAVTLSGLYRERLDFEKAEKAFSRLPVGFPTETAWRAQKILLDFMRQGLPRQPLSLAGLDLSAVGQPEQLAVLLLVSGQSNAARKSIGLSNEATGYAGTMVRFFLAQEPEQKAGLALSLASYALQEEALPLAENWLERARSLLGAGALTQTAWLRLQTRVALARGLPREAAASAYRLFRLQPRDGEAMGFLARAYAQLGRHDEALKLFMAAGDGDGLFSTAVTQAKAGQHELALRYTETLLTRAPLHAEAVRLQALALEQLRKTNEALALLRGWYRQGGRDSAVTALYARLEMTRGRIKPALQLIDEVLSQPGGRRSAASRTAPTEFAELLLLKGRCLLTSGRAHQAEALFAQALALGGLSRAQQIELYLWQGDALLAIGRLTSALTAWHRVQGLLPGEERSLQRIRTHERALRRSGR